MPRFKKQILAPGTYVTRSGPVTIAKSDIHAFATTGNAMMAERVSVPVPLEHQAQAKPVTDQTRLADMVRWNTGYVAGYEVDPQDGLWANLDINGIPYEKANGDIGFISEPKAVEHFINHNVKFVSPELLPSFQDGRGKVWNDVVSHVALTPVPVWHDQPTFGDGAAATPAALSRSNWRNTQGVSLSLDALWCAGKAQPGLDDVAGIKAPQAWTLAPAGGVVLSGTYFRGGTPVPLQFAGGNMAKDDKPDDAAAKPDDAPPPPVDDAAKPDDAPPPPDAPAPDDDPSKKSDDELIEEINAEMKELGVEITDHAKKLRPWAEHLLTAIKTHKATADMLGASQSPGGDQDQKPGDAAAAAGTPKEEPQVVTMSAVAAPAKPAAKPAVKPTAPVTKTADVLALEARIALLEADNKKQLSLNADANARAAEAEVRTLSGVIDGWIADGYVPAQKWQGYKELLNAKKLSVADGNDKAVNDVLDRIKITAEMIKDGDLPKGAVWPVDQRTELSTSPARPEHATFTGGEMTADRVKSVLAEVDSMLGRPAK